MCENTLNTALTLAVAPSESVTSTLNEYGGGAVPVGGGVGKVPARERPFKLILGGNEPVVSAKAYGWTPPLMSPNAPHTVTHPASTEQSCVHRPLAASRGRTVTEVA